VILAVHAICSFYGFWLPNDPRGSWSDWIRCWELLRFGGPTKTNARRSLASKPHDRQKRLDAKQALKYPQVLLNGIQARAVARGFARACPQAGYMVHACTIMPDHVHLVVARHSRLIEQVIQHMKSFATMELNAEHLHPLAPFVKTGAVPTPWAHGTGWTVYLNSRDEILRSIKYVEGNPEKEGLPPQSWRFVTPFV